MIVKASSEGDIWNKSNDLLPVDFSCIIEIVIEFKISVHDWQGTDY